MPVKLTLKSGVLEVFGEEGPPGDLSLDHSGYLTPSTPQLWGAREDFSCHLRFALVTECFFPVLPSLSLPPSL